MADIVGNPIYYLLILGALLLAPLLGAAWLDPPLATYLEFPPRTHYVVHAPFNLTVFIVLFLFEASICLLFLYRLLTYRSEVKDSRKKLCSFPWWGWLGCALGLLSWVLAWNRFSFFEPFQRYTFFPLWAGYILLLNGLIEKRQGHSPLSAHTRSFLWLFPVSALFWWYFEYLNRFVQNWYYPGSEEISGLEYIIHASICFSTVLPAVVTTYVFLSSFPRLTQPFKTLPPLKLHKLSILGLLLLGGSGTAFCLLALFPDYLFPFVWLSPLFIIVGFQLLSGRRSLLHDLEQGNWQTIVLSALAALCCGFFWEMWNWKSMARWEYSIPFVHRFEIFEMVLLGYAGYLPFGLECITVIGLISPKLLKATHPNSS